MSIQALILLLFLGLPTAASAQTWGDLDCRIVLDALQAQAREAGALRRNSATLSTTIRGTNYGLWEKTVEPQLVEVPDAEKDRALELVNILLRDRCPSN